MWISPKKIEFFGVVITTRKQLETATLNYSVEEVKKLYNQYQREKRKEKKLLELHEDKTKKENNKLR